MPECALRSAGGRPGLGCEGDVCVYWRAVEEIGIDGSPQPEVCAIQHFQLLEGGSEVAKWLLSVKERVEAGSRA